MIDYRAQRGALLAANKGYVIEDGYREIVTRYLFHGKEPAVHPLGSA